MAGEDDDSTGGKPHAADPRLDRASQPRGADAISQIEARLSSLFGPLEAALKTSRHDAAAEPGQPVEVSAKVFAGTVEDMLAARRGGTAPRAPVFAWQPGEEATALVVELPGAAPEATTWRIEGSALSVETTGVPAFALALTLPDALSGRAVGATHANGVLTLRFA
ncbi:MAG: hypothetical protein AAFQ75_00090 [Pseudomonadota bacterium]